MCASFYYGGGLVVSESALLKQRMLKPASGLMARRQQISPSAHLDVGVSEQPLKASHASCSTALGYRAPHDQANLRSLVGVEAQLQFR